MPKWVIVFHANEPCLCQRLSLLSAGSVIHALSDQNGLFQAQMVDMS